MWIPSSNSAGPFQFGGQQSLSTADGQLKAVTDGHSNTVGGTVKLPIPVVEASVKYDYQWNHSTTTTTSLTRTFTTISPKMPNDVIWRWRMYFKGYRFIATKWCHVPIPLVNAGDYYTKKQFIVPAAAKQYAFHVEKYSQRGWLVKMDGSTIKPWNN
ncbi:MAG TPA: hypothetical protein VN088_04805 [Nocardioides sp.]|nr:hypothetical protein [Nocardioides sp.]